MSRELESELGRVSQYDLTYNPARLFAIPRVGKRQEIGVPIQPLPFYGFDCWNHYEVSWLNEKGKPMVGVAEIIYDCATMNLIESKSLKLYFNSLNSVSFKDADTFSQLIQADLSQCVAGSVQVKVRSLQEVSLASIHLAPKGECIDDLDVACTTYVVNPDYLETEASQVEETLYSHLLKSNCLITNQPDWGTVQIAYQGRKIKREGLLKYLVSFRHHNEFHEQCIERIFMDILTRCCPHQLTVYGRYTRRGGLDINPYRSTEKQFDASALNQRLVRQ